MSDKVAMQELFNAYDKIALLRADLVREQRPWTVKLSIETMDGCEVCDCTVSDIGHADHILLVTCDDVERLKEQVAVLRDEVRAWRDADARHDLTRNVMGDGHNDDVLRAMTATNAAGALEDK